MNYEVLDIQAYLKEIEEQALFGAIEDIREHLNELWELVTDDAFQAARELDENYDFTRANRICEVLEFLGKQLDAYVKVSPKRA